jgi:hypothetical protein
VIRLLLPAAGIALFFVVSFVTVRVFHPRDPKRFFLIYLLLIAAGEAVIYPRLWPIATLEDTLGLVSGVLVQMLACFTMWNSFYSLLWGFSGGLMYDIVNDRALCARDALVRAYEGDGEVDRMMARRLPGMIGGGWLTRRGSELTLTPKGRVIALGTIASYKVFSLGEGGGIK